MAWSLETPSRVMLSPFSEFVIQPCHQAKSALSTLHHHKIMANKPLTLLLLILAFSLVWASPMPTTKQEVAEWNSAESGAVVLASEASKWDVVKHALGTDAFKKADDEVTLVDFQQDNVIFSDKEAEAILDQIVDEIIKELDGTDPTINALVADMTKDDKPQEVGFWEWFWSDEPFCASPEECFTDEDIAFMIVALALISTPIFTVLVVLLAQRRMLRLQQATQHQGDLGIQYVAVPNSTNAHSEKEMFSKSWDRFPAQIKL